MDGIRSVVDRFPHREFEIARRSATDPQFRAICADHGEAEKALCYWQKVAEDADQRIQEYRALLSELDSEILLRLDRAEPGQRCG